MDLKEINSTNIEINKHWYYSSKAKAIYRLLSGLNIKGLADIGAGSGFFSKFLLANGIGEEAWCIDINYPLEFDDIHHSYPIHFRHSINSLNVDLVMLMDVIEHVDDDINFLREYVDKCPAGTIFLITVPAFNVLWSKHDEFLGHKRRYSLSQLDNVVKQAGLSIDQTMYYFMFALPFAIIFRVLGYFTKNSSHAASNLIEHNNLTNFFFKLLCSVELIVMKFNKLAGLSVICLAKK